ncbi:hypothetical protein MNBD_NITROSPINAE03-1156, partial [hydrothermal vent metagenome]
TNSPARTSWAPQFVKSAINFLRIGKSKAAPQSLRAIFDESDPDTFAGHMAGARGETGEYSETGGAYGSLSYADRTSRGNMINQVTNSIRKRNTTLTIA